MTALPASAVPAGRALAIGRLLRLSLAPSALADAWLGVLVGAGRLPLEPALLVPLGASLAVYCGGLALNDVADRAEDARVRPDRPLPSGALTPRFATLLAVALLVAGPSIASLAGASAALAYGAVAALAVVYDVAGRGPWRGPVLLGLCRAGNVLAAAWTAALLWPGAWDELPRALVTLAAAYGAYVVEVSRLGRMEDDLANAPGQRPRAYLAVAAWILVLGPATAQGLPGESAGVTTVVLTLAAALALSFIAAGPLVKLAIVRRPWTHADVVRAMGMCLRRLMVFTSASALYAGLALDRVLDGALVAALILAGYPLSARLRRVFPPS